MSPEVKVGMVQAYHGSIALELLSRKCGYATTAEPAFAPGVLRTSKLRVAYGPDAVKPKPPRTSQSLNETLYVEKLIAGGLGFGRRHDGEPVFVRGAVPGDSVELQTLQRHNGYSRAEQFRLIQPSRSRRTPPCEYQDRCGGCDLMVLQPTAQRSAKHGMVLDILQRTAKLDATENGAVPLTWREPNNAQTLGYRSRIRLHISPQGQLGFRAEQSHTLVEVSRCLVANPAVNLVLDQLSRCAALNPTLFAAFEQVEIRVLGEQPDLLWFPVSKSSITARSADGKRRPARLAARNAPSSDPNHRTSNTLETLQRSLANLVPTSSQWLMSVAASAESWRANVQAVSLDAHPTAQPAQLLFAPGMFTQVNWQVNHAIIDDITRRASELGLRTFLDLYCGAGNFSIPLLATGLEGLGIEFNARAIEAAHTASAHQSYAGRFLSGDVPRMVAQLAAKGESFDLVLLDPPRAGFKDAAPHLPKVAHNAVFVCSCDPTTFARDVRSLLDLGFALDTLVAYDMFPQTHHLELTAWLHRART